jgi:hypothetical protein
MVRAFVFAMLAGLATAACERPFIEEAAPDIDVLSPNLDIVQIERSITLSIRTMTRVEVDSVFVNGLRMEADNSEADVFHLDFNLNRGVNQFHFEAFGSNSTVGTDTVQAIYLPSDTDVAELRLPSPRGGHSATKLTSGDLLVYGGAELPTGPAVNSALLFQSENLSLAPQTIPTLTPRMEHTATRLPNGQVLIIGGSIVYHPTRVEQLVETVELYHPGSNSVVSVPVQGDPIRRSSHTTIFLPVRQDGRVKLFFYLYGGYGDIRYRPTPRMGVRSDIRVFELRNDSLIAAGPTFGPLIDAIADHTASDIQPPFVGSDAEYLFEGSYFSSDERYETISFESRFSIGSGIFIEDLDPPFEPRTGHAAGKMVDGEIIIFGGRSFGLATAMNSIEVYYSRTKRFYRMPTGVGMLQERWGHSATNWGGNRILLLGGFGFAGAGLRTAEWFAVGPSSNNSAR